MATSASATRRLIRTSTSRSVINPPVSSLIRAREMVPRVVKVSGSQDSWLTTSQPG